MLPEVLQEIGLSEKEAKVYIALLQQGREVSSQEAAKSTLLPRTTMYDIFQSLSEKGLVVEKTRGSTKVFSIESPHHLFGFLEGRQIEISKSKQKLQTVIRQLELLQNPLSPVPSLRQFEGEQGIQAMWEQQLRETRDQDDALTIMCNHFFFAKFQDHLRALSKELAPKNYSVRVLVFSPEEDPVFIKIKNFEVKATQENYIFAAGMDVCGSFVGYWTEMDRLTGTLMEQQEIAKMQRAMFETIWRQLN